MKNKILSALCLFLFLSLYADGFSCAETGNKKEPNEVVSFGMCSILNDNLALAKECAIANALVKGIERYILIRLGRFGVVNNFQRLIQEIIPGAKEKIENFKILSEYKSNNEYYVLVHLRVNEILLNDKLREAAIVSSDHPAIKVLFLVSEAKQGALSFWWQDPEANTALSLTELTLHNEFQKRGFDPVNRTSGSIDNRLTEDMRSAYLSEEDILFWGRLFSSDIVLYGRSIIADNKDIFLTLEAFDVNKGISVSQGMQSEKTTSDIYNREKEMETLERLASSLAGQMIPAVIKSATSGLERIYTFGIVLENLSSFKQSKIFKDFLSGDIDGVKSVIQTGFKRNSISFSVDFQGDKDTFIQRVLNHERLPFPVGLIITEDGRILFEIEQGTL
ncbi:MAG: hypothetical protein JXA35_06045 [Deltaproteobacteria bacterium]|nr:hypothetical protein [Deltaproteobacteria bacterium]